jgi:hypothetical protein
LDRADADGAARGGRAGGGAILAQERNDPGNLAGTIVIFAAGVALIVRESVELNAVIAGCLDAGYTCWPVPSAFVRYAIYAAIALVEVVILFSWSLRVEQQMRNRHYAPEWR